MAWGASSTTLHTWHVPILNVEGVLKFTSNVLVKMAFLGFVKIILYGTWVTTRRARTPTTLPTVRQTLLQVHTPIGG